MAMAGSKALLKTKYVALSPSLCLCLCLCLCLYFYLCICFIQSRFEIVHYAGAGLILFGIAINLFPSIQQVSSLSLSLSLSLHMIYIYISLHIYGCYVSLHTHSTISENVQSSENASLFWLVLYFLSNIPLAAGLILRELYLKTTVHNPLPALLPHLPFFLWPSHCPTFQLLLHAPSPLSCFILTPSPLSPHSAPTPTPPIPLPLPQAYLSSSGHGRVVLQRMDGGLSARFRSGHCPDSILTPAPSC